MTAEISYQRRYAEGSNTKPRVHLLASKWLLERLPAHCETSIAHNAYLTRLIVCCRLVWSEVAFADTPMLFPASDEAVVHQLRPLAAKNILDRPSDTSEAVVGADFSIDL